MVLVRAFALSLSGFAAGIPAIFFRLYPAPAQSRPAFDFRSKALRYTK